MKIIYVNFLSRFCNNIFQYIYASLLHDKLKDKFEYKLVFSNKCINRNEIDTKTIPLYPFIMNNNFDYNKNYNGTFNDNNKIRKISEKVNFNVDLHKLRAIDIKKDIVLSGYFQDIKYYVDKKPYINDKLKYLLNLKINNKLTNNDVVVHIRNTDLIHRQYNFDYYIKCIDDNKFDRIFIISDDINHDNIKNLQKRYKNIILVSKGDGKQHNNEVIINDFLHLYYAKNIIMSISTFSWFGAWISNANKIYFPYDDRIYLKLHVNEDRYIYVDKKGKFKKYKDI